MENGFEVTKIRSTFILQKILMTEIGLNYICQTYHRFSHVALILVSDILDTSFISIVYSTYLTHSKNVFFITSVCLFLQFISMVTNIDIYNFNLL